LDGVIKGKRDREAAGKVAVFGILKHKGKFYTAVVSDSKARTLMPIISNKIKLVSIIYTDSWHSYNAPLDSS